MDKERITAIQKAFTLLVDNEEIMAVVYTPSPGMFGDFVFPDLYIDVTVKSGETFEYGLYQEYRNDNYYVSAIYGTTNEYVRTIAKKFNDVLDTMQKKSTE
jgi:hypothetical protein